MSIDPGRLICSTQNWPVFFWSMCWFTGKRDRK
jgi:hypothetical protein